MKCKPAARWAAGCSEGLVPKRLSTPSYRPAVGGLTTTTASTAEVEGISCTQSPSFAPSPARARCPRGIRRLSYLQLCRSASPYPRAILAALLAAVRQTQSRLRGALRASHVNRPFGCRNSTKFFGCKIGTDKLHFCPKPLQKPDGVLKCDESMAKPRDAADRSPAQKVPGARCANAGLDAAGAWGACPLTHGGRHQQIWRYVTICEELSL